MEGKASGDNLEPVWVRETTERKPSLTRRKPETRRRNQGRFDPLRQACQMPEYGAGGDRRIGGVNLIWALMRNCGNQCVDAKGEAQVDEPTRREYRCGALGRTNPSERRRLVMRPEQRGWIKRLRLQAQLETGGSRWR